MFVPSKPFQLSVMKQSNLLGRFISYEENGVLRIWYRPLAFSHFSATSFASISRPLVLELKKQRLKMFFCSSYLNKFDDDGAKTTARKTFV